MRKQCRPHRHHRWTSQSSQQLARWRAAATGPPVDVCCLPGGGTLLAITPPPPHTCDRIPPPLPSLGTPLKGQWPGQASPLRGRVGRGRHGGGAAGGSTAVNAVDSGGEAPLQAAVPIRWSHRADAAARSTTARRLLRARGVAAAAVAARPAAMAAAAATGVTAPLLPRAIRRHVLAAALALLLALLVTVGGVAPPRRCVRAANAAATAATERLSGFLACGISLGSVTAAAAETVPCLDVVAAIRASRHRGSVEHLLSQAGLAWVTAGGGVGG